jgi:pre-mRNA-processing factor 19
VSFHPDGLILGTGCADGSLKIWDVCNQKNVHTFEPVNAGAALTALVFSENGFYCATADAAGSVAVWDLRKLKNVKTFAAAEVAPGARASPLVSALDFDLSGQYLAVGSSSGAVRLLGVKEWNVVATYQNSGASAASEDSQGAVTGVKLGQHASFVVSVSRDRALRFYGSDGNSSMSDA